MVARYRQFPVPSPTISVEEFKNLVALRKLALIKHAQEQLNAECDSDAPSDEYSFGSNSAAVEDAEVFSPSPTGSVDVKEEQESAAAAHEAEEHRQRILEVRAAKEEEVQRLIRAKQEEAEEIARKTAACLEQEARIQGMLRKLDGEKHELVLQLKQVISQQNEWLRARQASVPQHPVVPAIIPTQGGAPPLAPTPPLLPSTQLQLPTPATAPPGLSSPQLGPASSVNLTSTSGLSGQHLSGAASQPASEPWLQPLPPPGAGPLLTSAPSAQQPSGGVLAATRHMLDSLPLSGTTPACNNELALADLKADRAEPAKTLVSVQIGAMGPGGGAVLRPVATLHSPSQLAEVPHQEGLGASSIRHRDSFSSTRGQSGVSSGQLISLVDAAGPDMVPEVPPSTGEKEVSDVGTREGSSARNVQWGPAPVGLDQGRKEEGQNRSDGTGEQEGAGCQEQRQNMEGDVVLTEAIGAGFVQDISRGSPAVPEGTPPEGVTAVPPVDMDTGNMGADLREEISIEEPGKLELLNSLTVQRLESERPGPVCVAPESSLLVNGVSLTSATTTTTSLSSNHHKLGEASATGGGLVLESTPDHTDRERDGGDVGKDVHGQAPQGLVPEASLGDAAVLKWPQQVVCGPESGTLMPAGLGDEPPPRGEALPLQGEGMPEQVQNREVVAAVQRLEECRPSSQTEPGMEVDIHQGSDGRPQTASSDPQVPGSAACFTVEVPAGTVSDVSMSAEDDGEGEVTMDLDNDSPQRAQPWPSAPPILVPPSWAGGPPLLSFSLPYPQVSSGSMEEPLSPIISDPKSMFSSPGLITVPLVSVPPVQRPVEYEGVGTPRVPPVFHQTTICAPTAEPLVPTHYQVGVVPTGLGVSAAGAREPWASADPVLSREEPRTPENRKELPLMERLMQDPLPGQPPLPLTEPPPLGSPFSPPPPPPPPLPLSPLGLRPPLPSEDQGGAQRSRPRRTWEPAIPGPPQPPSRKAPWDIPSSMGAVVGPPGSLVPISPHSAGESSPMLHSSRSSPEGPASSMHSTPLVPYFPWSPNLCSGPVSLPPSISAEMPPQGVLLPNMALHTPEVLRRNSWEGGLPRPNVHNVYNPPGSCSDSPVLHSPVASQGIQTGMHPGAFQPQGSLPDKQHQSHTPFGMHPLSPHQMQLRAPPAPPPPRAPAGISTGMPPGISSPPRPGPRQVGFPPPGQPLPPGLVGPHSYSGPSLPLPQGLQGANQRLPQHIPPPISQHHPHGSMAQLGSHPGVPPPPARPGPSPSLQIAPPSASLPVPPPPAGHPVTTSTPALGQPSDVAENLHPLSALPPHANLAAKTHGASTLRDSPPMGMQPDGVDPRSGQASAHVPTGDAAPSAVKRLPNKAKEKTPEPLEEGEVFPVQPKAGSPTRRRQETTPPPPPLSPVRQHSPVGHVGRSPYRPTERPERSRGDRGTEAMEYRVGGRSSDRGERGHDRGDRMTDIRGEGRVDRVDSRLEKAEVKAERGDGRQGRMERHDSKPDLAADRVSPRGEKPPALSSYASSPSSHMPPPLHLLSSSPGAPAGGSRLPPHLHASSSGRNHPMPLSPRDTHPPPSASSQLPPHLKKGGPYSSHDAQEQRHMGQAGHLLFPSGGPRPMHVPPPPGPWARGRGGGGRGPYPPPPPPPGPSMHPNAPGSFNRRNSGAWG